MHSEKMLMLRDGRSCPRKSVVQNNVYAFPFESAYGWSRPVGHG